MTELPSTSQRPYDVLLLDFGGVCLVNPVERHAAVERHFDLEPGALQWMGPLDVANDEPYRRSIASSAFSERDYWEHRAREVGELAGIDLSTYGYMQVAFGLEDGEESLIRPGAVSVCARARESGLGVSVLTNDLHAFHGQEWVSQIAFLGGLDHLVDCSTSGFLKPDPRAYERALAVLRSTTPTLTADRVLFVDDQPLNVEGASSFGLGAMFFDIADARRSWAHVAERLGL